MRVLMDVGNFRPNHKSDRDYVLWQDLSQLLGAFDELRAKVVDSSVDIQDNSSKDVIGRILLGGGGAVILMILLAVNSRDKIKTMLMNLASQPHAGTYPMQSIQPSSFVPAQQLCVRPYSGH